MREIGRFVRSAAGEIRPRTKATPTGFWFCCLMVFYQMAVPTELFMAAYQDRMVASFSVDVHVYALAHADAAAFRHSLSTKPYRTPRSLT